MTSDTDVSPYDALLLVSFGGPEGPDDVLPFLENVTSGRGIPRERLLEVGAHYLDFGGISPINAQNRALVASLQADLAEHGVDLPVYWGNRNWEPYLDEAVAAMVGDGIRNALAFVTSAFSRWRTKTSIARASPSRLRALEPRLSAMVKASERLL